MRDPLSDLPSLYVTVFFYKKRAAIGS